MFHRQIFYYSIMSTLLFAGCGEDDGPHDNDANNGQTTTPAASITPKPGQKPNKPQKPEQPDPPEDDEDPAKVEMEPMSAELKQALTRICINLGKCFQPDKTTLELTMTCQLSQSFIKFPIPTNPECPQSDIIELTKCYGDMTCDSYLLEMGQCIAKLPPNCKLTK